MYILFILDRKEPEPEGKPAKKKPRRRLLMPKLQIPDVFAPPQTVPAQVPDLPPEPQCAERPIIFDSLPDSPHELSVSIPAVPMDPPHELLIPKIPDVISQPLDPKALSEKLAEIITEIEGSEVPIGKEKTNCNSALNTPEPVLTPVEPVLTPAMEHYLNDLDNFALNTPESVLTPAMEHYLNDSDILGDNFDDIETWDTL
jgi:hypothetical protein